MKMYCVVARDSLKAMNGNRGKLAAQAGHVFLHAYWDAEERFDGSADILEMSPTEYYRFSGKAKKVTLVVDTVDDLKALYDAYRPICGVSLVVDAGLTCFNGVPTTTCLGIGPITNDQIGDDLKALKVLI